MELIAKKPPMIVKVTLIGVDLFLWFMTLSFWAGFFDNIDKIEKHLITLGTLAVTGLTLYYKILDRKDKKRKK